MLRSEGTIRSSGEKQNATIQKMRVGALSTKVLGKQVVIPLEVGDTHLIWTSREYASHGSLSERMFGSFGLER